MPLIEGVGDEVVQFVGTVVVMAVAALAWWSTSARPDRYRTVLLMRSRAPHPLTVSIRTRPGLVGVGTQSNVSTQSTATDPMDTDDVDEATGDRTRVIPLQEMDSIVDADMAMINHHRLHFYRRVDTALSVALESGSESGSESEGADEEAARAQVREMDSIVSAMEGDAQPARASELDSRCVLESGSESGSESEGADEEAARAQVREMDSIVSAMEGDAQPARAISESRSNDVITSMKGEPQKKNQTDSASANVTSSVDEASAVSNESNTNTSEGAENATESSQETGDARKILIKLKYLNDTLKEVDGSLDELLKDFKWRHFATELTASCRVRLIFNGRVLADDASTLRACGLHHRAVVHCLVHPSNNTQRVIRDEGVLAAPGAPERTWDLENILMTLVSVALTVVWFFRCEYSNMFTASASVALFGLTVFYSVAIFGLYLSDTFHFDRRPQPVPAN
ncbi:transmembrane and ubiquitin-like domain-containing protein 2 [Plutella xylostella]|uniref:transmembrane and ubiquitin-like domain-containing protein 2 n=1 Tax=Plutella xylostella TaxID=51655 RepID=UPI002032BB2F|nr:transmembrane and ubiquitin-like domain-containing protein 2 [Plutella xylostella]